MSKQALRAKLIEKRLSLSEKFIYDSSSIIQNRLFKIKEINEFSNVLIYLPTKKEVATAEIVEALWTAGKKLFLPAYNGDWIVSRYSQKVPVTAGYREMLQPKVIKQVELGIIDLAIVPGVAFSKSGLRLGYGLGVYDRLLTNTNALKIGICFDFQLVEIEGEPHDVKMDFIVTEKKRIFLKSIYLE